MRYGRIVGHAGYVDPVSRLVMVNPDATPDAQLAALADGLGLLMEADAASPDLELAHSVDEPEDPSPPRLRTVTGSPRVTSGFRVVG